MFAQQSEVELEVVLDIKQFFVKTGMLCCWRRMLTSPFWKEGTIK